VEVGVLNLTLPPLGIPPREPGGGCQILYPLLRSEPQCARSEAE
jgi:hypothetical protein